MQTIRVIAAIVDTKRLTLYKEDGTTVEIPQGDVRLAAIVAKLNPILAVPGAVAEIDLAYGKEANHYEEYEAKSNGLVKFFRVAKSKLKEFFGKVEAVPSQVIGSLVQTASSHPSTPEEDEALNEMLSPTVIEPVTAVKQEALTEILKHAIPASAPTFHTSDIGIGDENRGDTDADTSTVMAMVGNQIIPDAHKLAPQIQRANEKNDPAALAKFLERLAKLTATRRHSTEDLLKFMSRGDLPIADDGSIVIFKVLNRSGERYVDCYTGKVSQTIGSYVHMDEKLVDPNNRNECSNGLHVARRQFISGFPGNVCVLAKVNPEDVIAVPKYDANKMRVKGYHILFEFSMDDYGQLRHNLPLKSEQGLAMLTRALRGDHIGITEYVEITEHNGGGVKITPAKGAKEAPKPAKAKVKPQDLEKPLEQPVPKKEVKAPAVDPKAVAKQAEVTKGKSQTQVMLDLYDKAIETEQTVDVEAVFAYKKAVKKGWAVLGVSDKMLANLEKLRFTGTSPEKLAKPEAQGKSPAPGKSPRDQIAALLPITTKAKAEQAQAIKKAAKKSWEALGVSDHVLSNIQHLLGTDKK